MNANIPKLRFSEFKGNWQVESFSSIFERITRKNTENNKNILTISAQDGLISQEKFFSKLVSAKDVTNYYLLHQNEYAYNKSYSKGYPMGAIKRLIDDDRGVVSTLYICFRSKIGSESFFDQYFETGKQNNEIEKIAQEGARNHGLLNMSVGDFFDMKVIIPDLAEQQKIADFLTVVDDKISAIDKKVELLKQYKKGAMQKIFRQEIRFRDENGDFYPEWNKKTINTIAHKENSSIYFDDAEKEFGKYKVFGASGYLYSSNKYDQEEEYLAIVKDGAGVGRLMHCEAKSSVLNTLNIIKPEKGIDIRFLYETLCLINFNKYKKGNTIPHIYFNDYSREEFNIPSFFEQQKIANFLTAIDDKINLTEQKLNQARQFKKFLLQRILI